ncbi:hypothetical protein BDY19DRAFT_903222 [Irpex rosettiformis]|uniref:Uncharacterized protein n=1 Tax=Irpex rosettiformis TaxID=378272 RepID=A0ACB8UH42_9APHY|nr:hypothetical protein BDY19DRAFT_903222 [Irpex rosettiformis]
MSHSAQVASAKLDSTPDTDSLRRSSTAGGEDTTTAATIPQPASEVTYPSQRDESQSSHDGPSTTSTPDSHSLTLCDESESEKQDPVDEPTINKDLEGRTLAKTTTPMLVAIHEQPKPTPGMDVRCVPGLVPSPLETNANEQWGQLPLPEETMTANSLDSPPAKNPKSTFKFNFRIGRLKCNGDVYGPCAPCVAVFCCPCLSMCWCATGAAAAKERVKRCFED